MVKVSFYHRESGKVETHEFATRAQAEKQLQQAGYQQHTELDIWVNPAWLAKVRWYAVRKYIISGPPVTKKNHQQILTNRSTGRPFIAQGNAYKRYEQTALLALRPKPAEPMMGPINLRCLYYMPTRRRVDLVNLLEATNDILVKAGILTDDNCKVVAGHDGSRVLYDKDNPRVEIYIDEMGD